MTHKERQFVRAVGRNLKKYRKKVNMSQRQVYVRTEITQNSISNYEHGARDISLVRLYKLAQVYGCTVSDLVEV